MGYWCDFSSRVAERAHRQRGQEREQQAEQREPEQGLEPEGRGQAERPEEDPESAAPGGRLGKPDGPEPGVVAAGAAEGAEERAHAEAGRLAARGAEEEHVALGVEERVAARGRSEERAGDEGKVARRERCAYGLLAGEREQERESVVAVESAGLVVAASPGVGVHGTWEAGWGRLGDAVGAAGVGAGVVGDVVDAEHVAAAAAAVAGRRRESPWAAGRDESTRAADHNGSGWNTRRMG